MTTLVQLEGLSGQPVLVNPRHVTFVVVSKSHLQGCEMILEDHVRIELVTKTVFLLRGPLDHVKDVLRKAEVEIKEGSA